MAIARNGNGLCELPDDEECPLDIPNEVVRTCGDCPYYDWAYDVKEGIRC